MPPIEIFCSGTQGDLSVGEILDPDAPAYAWATRLNLADGGLVAYADQQPPSQAA